MDRFAYVECDPYEIQRKYHRDLTAWEVQFFGYNVKIRDRFQQPYRPWTGPKPAGWVAMVERARRDAANYDLVCASRLISEDACKAMIEEIKVWQMAKAS